MKRSDITNKEVCKAVEQCQKEWDKLPYKILAEKFGCNKKLASSACKRAERDGLIGCGIYLRTCWLTEKGKQILIKL